MLAISRELEPGVTEVTDMDVVEMLAYLRCLCDRHDWNYAELDRMGYRHYLDLKSIKP